MIAIIRKWVKGIGRKHQLSSFQRKSMQLEEVIKKLPEHFEGDSENCPLKHTFVDGAYVREIFMPKGMLIVSKIHKVTHPYFVLSGDVSVATDEGLVRIKAPFSGVTKAGTKRALYTHEDTVWVTVHVTKETNLRKIEKQIIAKNFNELPTHVGELLKLTEV